MKRCLGIGLLLFCLACFREAVLPAASAADFETAAASPRLSEAERITEQVTVSLDGADVTKALCDDAYSTRITVQSGQALTVESGQLFSALYIVWDRVPGEYSLVWDGGRAEFGGEGFLHDYARLPEEVHCVTFEFPQDAEIQICDIRLYSPGEPPEDVQEWLPPCDTADILVFPTHSDDDVLFFGAVMAYYAKEEKLSVQTAYMVDHWYQRERDHERLDGLWALGVRNYPILGTARDYMSKSLYETEYFHRNDHIPEWQVEQIRRFQPLVILGHDLNGEYGHGQHKLNAQYLTESVEAAADPAQCCESAQRYGVWDTPKLYLHLYQENELIFDVNTPLEQDAEGRTPFEIAESAYTCHVSQQECGFRVSQREQNWDCRRFGLYRTLVGYDKTGDLMENIESSKWR